jgi:hypothetical protein
VPRLARKACLSSARRGCFSCVLLLLQPAEVESDLTVKQLLGMRKGDGKGGGSKGGGSIQL